MGTLTSSSFFADMDLLGSNLSVADVLWKMLQNTASAVSKLKGWGPLGETPCPSTLSPLLVTAFIVCHMRANADPLIP